MVGTHHVFLLRHGQVAGPAALYGKTDIALSAAGHNELNSQLARVLPLTRVVSSPLKRCLDFAKSVSEREAIPLHVEAGFRECNFGRWDGVPFDDIPTDCWGDLEKFWHAPSVYHFDNAEPLQVMQARVVAAWGALLQMLQNESQPQRVLLVTHGGVIRLVLASVLGVNWANPALFSQWQIGYGSVSLLTLLRGGDTRPIINYVALPADVASKAR